LPDLQLIKFIELFKLRKLIVFLLKFEYFWNLILNNMMNIFSIDFYT